MLNKDKIKFHKAGVEKLVAELNSKIENLDSTDATDRAKMQLIIKEVVNKASFDAEGKTTVFYAGAVDGVNSFAIANKMRHNKDIRVINAPRVIYHHI